MTRNLFFTEILMIIISSIAFLVFWQLYRTKDGMLRKIMMAYMLIEIFVYEGSGIYFWLYEYGIVHFTIDTFRMLVLPPKAGIMLFLFFWLRDKDNLHH